MGEITELNPKINKILKIFDPMILPKARSFSLRFAAIIVALNSGSDVPIATANNDIKASETWSNFPIVIEDETTHCPPKGSKIHPAEKSRIAFFVESECCSETSKWGSLFWVRIR